MSEFCVQALKEAEINPKDIIRIRLSLEEILEGWLTVSVVQLVNVRPVKDLENSS